MREDWLVLTQLKVVTGLWSGTLQEEEVRARLAGQSRSLNSPNQPSESSPQPQHYRGLVEWTTLLPSWHSDSDLCFLLTGGEEAGPGQGVVITLVISFWRT